MTAAVKNQLKWGPVTMLTSDGVWTETDPASSDDSESRKEKLRRGKREAKQKGQGIFDNEYYYGGQYREQTPGERNTMWKCITCGANGDRHAIFGKICKKCDKNKGEVQ